MQYSKTDYKKIVAIPASENAYGKNMVFRTKKDCAKYFGFTMTQIEDFINLGTPARGYFFDYAMDGILTDVAPESEFD